MGSVDELKNIIISMGDVINNHKVVSDVYYKEIGKDHKRRRFCLIECLKTGDVIETSELALKKGKTGACRHCRNNTGRMKGNPQNNNTYSFDGDIGIGHTNDGEEFYFDKEDYDLIKNYTWYINKQGYVQTQKNKKKILMHRLVINADDNYIVDHKNRIRNCNLKSNLNLVTKRENAQNHSMYKNNTSGINGVSWSKSANKWTAYIQVDKNRINGGYFDNIIDAKKQRKLLEREYFDYYSKL